MILSTPCLPFSTQNNTLTRLDFSRRSAARIMLNTNLPSIQPYFIMHYCHTQLQWNLIGFPTSFCNYIVKGFHFKSIHWTNYMKSNCEQVFLGIYFIQKWTCSLYILIYSMRLYTVFLVFSYKITGQSANNW